MADARALGDSAALDDTDDPLGQSSRFRVPLLKHHTRGINSAQFSPDSTKVVTASFDKTAVICDVETGKVLVRLEHHTAVVYSAEFSPNGTKVVTASRDNTAAVCDAETGTVLRLLKSSQVVLALMHYLLAQLGRGNEPLPHTHTCC